LKKKLNGGNLNLKLTLKPSPPEKANPSATTGAPQVDATFAQSLADAEKEKKEIEALITKTQDELRTAERRNAVAKRLLEKLDNFKKDFDVFVDSLADDSTELGLVPSNLASFSLKKADVEKIRDDSAFAISTAKGQLAQTNPNGIKKRQSDNEAKLTELQNKLDAPNRIYQEYLRQLKEWQDIGAKIEGDETDPESLKGLRASLKALGELPNKITNVRSEQLKVALEIHDEKLAQAQVYRDLYQPVQQFIDSHSLAKNKLKLEFRAELTNEDFTNRLLGLLALNRRGSFMGIDEGRARADSFVQITDWSKRDSVSNFLTAVDQSLHSDQRESPAPAVQLRDQLPKGKKAEEVFEMLYGLEYIQPRYILRWEGKDISMLSPGERGTLLLVFYLLIDKGDMPLVIDQPEGNLDNHTVAKILVDCIREARKRRQIFIVTHNPNLAVVCDADQVIHANMDKSGKNAISYTCGALENPQMSQFVTDVLEGTRWAFGVRGSKYQVAEKVSS
jgi:hypothetical protein